MVLKKIYICDKHIKTFYNKKLFIEFIYIYIYKNMILLYNFYEIKIITRRHPGDLKSFAIRSKSIIKKIKSQILGGGKPILGGGNAPPSDPQMTPLQYSLTLLR